MPPLSPMALFQQAITSIITTREPALIAIALYWLDRFAIVLIVVEAVTQMAASGPLPERWFRFLQTMFFIELTRTMLVFYNIPLFGVVSFSHLVSDTSLYLVNLLDTNGLEQIHAHLDVIWHRVDAPSYLAWFALFVYYGLLSVILISKMLTIFVVGGSFVAAAVCSLLGPLFIPFLIWKPMSWLFWGWLRAYIQYSFVPVVAVAYLMVYEQFIAGVTLWFPPHVAVADYSIYVYTVIVMIGILTIGVASIPRFTASLFSGHMHDSGAGGMLLSALVRR
jgi:TrbL/VirB6 plasmid conjugal transfer protein